MIYKPTGWYLSGFIIHNTHKAFQKIHWEHLNVQLLNTVTDLTLFTEFYVGHFDSDSLQEF